MKASKCEHTQTQAGACLHTHTIRKEYEIFHITNLVLEGNRQQEIITKIRIIY